MYTSHEKEKNRTHSLCTTGREANVYTSSLQHLGGIGMVRILIMSAKRGETYSSVVSCMIKAEIQSTIFKDLPVYHSTSSA